MVLKLKKETWILLATILGSSMAFIDANVVNVALPRIQHDLAASADSVQWVVESYALFLGALILVGGSLGDMYGRKRIFAIGIAGFALASIGCGLATSINQLIVARSLQGICGALLTPSSLAILRSAFDDQQRGRAIGLWSGFTSITSALGPVIGGWLVQNAGWRWVFFINIPLAAVVLLILFWHVPEMRSEQRGRHLDIVGALLATLSLGALVFGLIESGPLGLFNPLVLSCLFVGILMFGGFILQERRSPAPIMSLDLFRSSTFSGANLLTFFLYAALGGALYFLPFNLINVQGYSATEAGGALLPFTILMFSLSRWSGGLSTRYGSRLPLVVGPLLVTIAYILFAIPGIGGSYWTTYFPAVIVLSLGMSITVPTLTTTVMGVADESNAGVASGVNNAVARVASLMAIAVFGIFVLLAFSSALNSHLAALHLTPELSRQMAAQSTKLTGAQVPPGVDAATAAALNRSIAESFLAGFRLVMLIAAGCALVSALFALFMIPPRVQPS
ncbi:MAG TPA: MFS transporter, partial [Ktedonobacteraceae bacterium]|nr:MFS transporter [Ktedonobacteraceae bacterium]